MDKRLCMRIVMENNGPAQTYNDLHPLWHQNYPAWSAGTYYTRKEATPYYTDRPRSFHFGKHLPEQVQTRHINNIRQEWRETLSPQQDSGSDFDAETRIKTKVKNEHCDDEKKSLPSILKKSSQFESERRMKKFMQATAVPSELIEEKNPQR